MSYVCNTCRRFLDLLMLAAGNSYTVQLISPLP